MPKVFQAETVSVPSLSKSPRTDRYIYKKHSLRDFKEVLSLYLNFSAFRFLVLIAIQRKHKIFKVLKNKNYLEQTTENFIN